MSLKGDYQYIPIILSSNEECFPQQPEPGNGMPRFVLQGLLLLAPKPNGFGVRSGDRLQHTL